MNRSLFWFRRDLRAHDNTGLIAAAAAGQVLPIFIFGPTQIRYFRGADPRLGFLIEACRALDAELRQHGNRLHVYWGDPAEIIPQLVKEHQLDTVHVNKPVSTHYHERDATVAAAAGCTWHAHEDTAIVPINRVEVRKVYSPFYRLWEREEKREPAPAPEHIARLPNAPDTDNDAAYAQVPAATCAHWQPQDLRARLTEFDFQRYHDTRNNPDIDGSSRLSPYLRHGLVSCREAYVIGQRLQKETFVKELAWREFWWHIAHHFPASLTEAFQEKRRGIPWEHDEEKVKRWQEGITGFPMVDAGMRQLRETGWMHNRVRMVVANFLTKDLHQHWQLGEQHFARYLLDYDEAVNIGNWQWSASIGADPKPMRVFNPRLQAETWDTRATYIREWIPELADASTKEILSMEGLTQYGYPAPMVDHRAAVAKTKEMFYETANKQHQMSLD